MKSASPSGTDRGCSVSINAYLTLPRSTPVVQANNVNPTGIRFEYSWSNSVPDLSPTPSRRSNTGRTCPSTENEPNIRWTQRNDSSSGYGSGDTPPVVAATLTVSHPAGSPNLGGETGRRAVQPYERRCRSTCSITLQTCHDGPAHQPPTQTVPESGNYPLRPHHYRRCSEGETWNSHTKVPQILMSPTQQPTAPADVSVPPAGPSVPVDTVKRREGGGRKKSRERPRTVHIDVYCTASESEGGSCSDESDESNESNTSTCYTVVRTDQAPHVRHVRKKNSLPHSLNQKNGNGPALKPVLSYRISAKELAEAVERKRGISKTPEASDMLDDELFRDLTLTDSSVQSLLADSEPESSEARYTGYSQDSVMDFEETGRTWRSPEEERKRKMLEQRKQQWRAAKMAEKCEESQRLTVSRVLPVPQPSSRDNTLLNPDDLRFKLQRHLLGGSEKVSRCNSQRCPSLNVTPPPTAKGSTTSIQSSRPMTMTSSSGRITSPSLSCSSSMTDSNSSVDPAARIIRQNISSPIQFPWQWRVQQPASPIHSPLSTSPGTWGTKKFGRHVGPARNPDCSCTHCLDHFARLRSIKENGGMIRL